MMGLCNNGRKYIKHHKNILTGPVPRGNPLSRGQEQHFSQHDAERLCVQFFKFENEVDESTQVAGQFDF